MNLEEQLQTMQKMKAPGTLKSKLKGMVADLPAKHTGLYFPLIAFQGAIVLGVLLLLVGLGSSVVVAAEGSHPGSALYPVRQAIEKVPFLQTTVTPTVMPVRSAPTSIPQVSPSEEKHEEGKTKNGEGNNSAGFEKKNVKGVSTSVSQDKETIVPSQTQKQYRVENFFRSFFHTNKSNSSSRQKDN